MALGSSPPFISLGAKKLHVAKNCSAVQYRVMNKIKGNSNLYSQLTTTRVNLFSRRIHKRLIVLHKFLFDVRKKLFSEHIVYSCFIIPWHKHTVSPVICQPVPNFLILQQPFWVFMSILLCDFLHDALVLHVCLRQFSLIIDVFQPSVSSKITIGICTGLWMKVFLIYCCNTIKLRIFVTKKALGKRYQLRLYWATRNESELGSAYGR